MWNQAWLNDCRENIDYMPIRLQPTINIKCCIHFHSWLTGKQAMPCHPCTHKENNLHQKTWTAVERPLLLEPAALVKELTSQAQQYPSAQVTVPLSPQNIIASILPSVWWNQTDMLNSGLRYLGWFILETRNGGLAQTREETKLWWKQEWKAENSVFFHIYSWIWKIMFTHRSGQSQIHIDSYCHKSYG